MSVKQFALSISEGFKTCMALYGMYILFGYVVAIILFVVMVLIQVLVDEVK